MSSCGWSAEAGGGAAPLLTPVVRSRLVGHQRSARNPRHDRCRRGGPDSDGAWYLRREYVLTYAAELPPTNVARQRALVGRRRRGAARSSPSRRRRPRSSESVLGDRLTFEVQGVPVEAEVTSIAGSTGRRCPPTFS